MLAFIITLMNVAIPTQKEAAAIILVPAVINNEEIKKLPTNMAHFLNTQLEEWAKEAMPNTVEK